jgi:hypothetical protein
MYKSAGFHFWTGGRSGEAIKVRYKPPGGGSEVTPSDDFMTNNLTIFGGNDTDEDKAVRAALIEWMKKVVKEDKTLSKEKKRHDREVTTFDPNE